MDIPVVTPDQMYKLDQAMMNEFNIPSPVLMENAAKAVFNVLHETVKDLELRRLVVFVGPGKNGEDALVLARQLSIYYTNLLVIILPSVEDWRASTKLKINTLLDLEVIVEQNDIPELYPGDIVVDGIFGIGLSRPPTGIYAEAINSINQSSAFVISIDIPSGVNGKTGLCNGIAVDSDICVSFGLIKIGNLINDGYTHCDLLNHSFLNSPYNRAGLLHNVTNLYVNSPAELPLRCKVGFKNTFGKCLVVGGAANYHGAPLFSSSGFMRSGGGYVHLVSINEVVESIAARMPEPVFHPFTKNSEGTLPHNAIATIEQVGESQDIIIIGPGMGVSETTSTLLKNTLCSERLSRVPILVDGDGLSILAKDPAILHKREPYTTILTPHFGEMSRLTGLSIPDIQENQIDIVKDFSQQWKVYLVLKGPRSLITNGESVYINTSGTEALATAGSGDVLDGIIAAFLCAFSDKFIALKTAVFLHGLIGNVLSESEASCCCTASDIIKAIPDAIIRLPQYTNNNKKRTLVSLPGIRFQM